MGKIEGSRKRGRPNKRWTDSIEKAIGMSLQELSRAVENKTRWTSLIPSTGGRADSTGCNTYKNVTKVKIIRNYVILSNH